MALNEKILYASNVDAGLTAVNPLISLCPSLFQKGLTMARTRRQYGCLGFLFDCFMTLLTGGLWLIWIFVREMRSR